MDAHDVETIVSLDGMWGDVLTEHLDRYDRAHPGRFLTFCQVDWSLLATPDPRGTLRQLMTARDPLYTEAAHVVIDTGASSVNAVVKHVLARLNNIEIAP